MSKKNSKIKNDLAKLRRLVSEAQSATTLSFTTKESILDLISRIGNRIDPQLLGEAISIIISKPQEQTNLTSGTYSNNEPENKKETLEARIYRLENELKEILKDDSIFEDEDKKKLHHSHREFISRLLQSEKEGHKVKASACINDYRKVAEFALDNKLCNELNINKEIRDNIIQLNEKAKTDTDLHNKLINYHDRMNKIHVELSLAKAVNNKNIIEHLGKRDLAITTTGRKSKIEEFLNNRIIKEQTEKVRVMQSAKETNFQKVESIQVLKEVESKQQDINPLQEKVVGLNQAEMKAAEKRYKNVSADDFLAEAKIEANSESVKPTQEKAAGLNQAEMKAAEERYKDISADDFLAEVGIETNLESVKPTQEKEEPKKENTKVKEGKDSNTSKDIDSAVKETAESKKSKESEDQKQAAIKRVKKFRDGLENHSEKASKTSSTSKPVPYGKQPKTDELHK